MSQTRVSELVRELGRDLRWHERTPDWASPPERDAQLPCVRDHDRQYHEEASPGSQWNTLRQE